MFKRVFFIGLIVLSQFSYASVSTITDFKFQQCKSVAYEQGVSAKIPLTEEQLIEFGLTNELVSDDVFLEPAIEETGLSEVVVNDGVLEDSIRDIIVQTGWSELKDHYQGEALIPQAFKILLDTAPYPLSSDGMLEVLDVILKKSKIHDVAIKIHEYEKIIVLAKKKIRNTEQKQAEKKSIFDIF